MSPMAPRRAPINMQWARSAQGSRSMTRGHTPSASNGQEGLRHRDFGGLRIRSFPGDLRPRIGRGQGLGRHLCLAAGGAQESPGGGKTKPPGKKKEKEPVAQRALTLILNTTNVPCG